MIVARNGELHPSTARFYHEYGKALVQTSKADKDVFAKIEAATASKDEEKQEKAKPADAGVSEPAAEVAAAVASPSNTSTTAAAEEQKAVAEPAAPETSAADGAKQEAEPEAADPKPDDGGAASAEMVEARELAWELLESARVVYEKSGDASAKHLEIAAVHC